MFTTLLWVVCVLLSIAFITLLERKVLGLRQVRLGVNKVRLFGILQPLLDGLKLFGKRFLLLSKIYKLMFILFPLVMFCLIGMSWSLIIRLDNLYSRSLSILFIFIVFGLSVYPAFLSGLRSYSKYRTIGRVRSSVVRVSYELLLTITILSVIFFIKTAFLLFYVFRFWAVMRLIIWLICILLETNRTPFDLREGESELIRGFNIEYSSVGFVLLFLREYGSILFIAYITTALFFNNSFFMFVIFTFYFLITRATYPRIKYDKTIKLCWIILLPVLTLFFTFIIML